VQAWRGGRLTNRCNHHHSAPPANPILLWERAEYGTLKNVCLPRLGEHLFVPCPLSTLFNSLCCVRQRSSRSFSPSPNSIRTQDTSLQCDLCSVRRLISSLFYFPPLSLFPFPAVPQFLLLPSTEVSALTFFFRFAYIFGFLSTGRSLLPNSLCCFSLSVILKRQTVVYT